MRKLERSVVIIKKTSDDDEEVLLKTDTGIFVLNGAVIPEIEGQSDHITDVSLIVLFSAYTASTSISGIPANAEVIVEVHRGYSLIKGSNSQELIMSGALVLSETGYL